MAAGPDIKPGEVPKITILDVTPTLLAMMRLPVSDELPGRVRSEVLRTDFFEEEPLRRTVRYDTPTVAVEAPEADSASEEENLRTLKALGYISGSTEVAADESTAEVDFWEIDARFRNRALQGELVFHLLNDDLGAARQLVKLVAERDPVTLASLMNATKLQVDSLEEELPGTPFSAQTLEQFDRLLDNVRRSSRSKERNASPQASGTETHY